MSGRRVPLSNNPNAANINSPFRAVAVAAAKQKRSHANIQREEAYGQQPPVKKQMLETGRPNPRSPSRPTAISSTSEGRVFTRKSAAPTQFEKKLEAARKPVNQAGSRQEQTSTERENQESIRQWQRHYRRMFPTYVFYFDSIPDERYAKEVAMLGARVDNFFSSTVTHVVTLRPIPTGNDVAAETSISSAEGGHPRTINPLLLDRSTEATGGRVDAAPSKSRSALDAAAARKNLTYHDINARKAQAQTTGVLHRAKELGIKIWQVEKLDRILSTIFHQEPGQSHEHNTRSNTFGAAHTVPRSAREADLSQLLRNERLNGPTDRDLTVATQEMVIFKGPFLYISDINEKQKPIMVKEYAKVASKEDGDWPQFRSVANGKCPFVPEVDSSRREAEREQLRLQKQAEREKAAAMPRTRAAAAEERMAPPKKHVLEDVTGTTRMNQVSAIAIQSNPFIGPETSKPGRRIETVDKQNWNAFQTKEPSGRFFRGEPVASGLQQSNITSAIRSQMISSTSAAPGVKAGTSKEIHGLQRKVLERNNSNPPSLGLTSSHRMTDIIAAAKEDAAARPAKRSLAYIDEELSTETEYQAKRAEAARKSKMLQKKKAEHKDLKPGYCENCMDKFEDFDEHILSRKHRKFAERNENWTELDSLLTRLVRPLKEY